MKLQAICVFCGSNYGVDPVYEQTARDFGFALVKNGQSLVYGGGKIGLMGVIADAVIEAGGHATGVIPHVLVDREQAHQGVSKLEIVSDIRERKARMMALSDAFVALPGGLGTFEELFEVLSWSQIQLHHKPCGVLNVNGFFDPLFDLLHANVAAGFMRQADRSLMICHDQPHALLTALQAYQPLRAPKFLPRGMRDNPLE